MWLLLACRPDIDGPGPTLAGYRVQETDNPQVFRVSFDTDEAAVGAVEFGPSGGPPTLRLEDAGTTVHDLVVLGLHAGESWDLVGSATDDRGRTTRAPAETVEVPPLPEGAVRPSLVAGATDGWTLFDVTVQGSATLQVALVDEGGDVVWRYDPRRGEDVGALDVKLTPGRQILVAGSVPAGERPVELGLDGEVRWEGPVQPAFEADGFMHHHTDPAPGGGHVFLEKDVRNGKRGDRVVLRDADDEVVWTWSTWDHWTPDFTVAEWTHLNWVELRDDVFFLSDQESSTIWKIDRATGNPIWSLGEGGDFTLTSGSWFKGQHAPEWGPDGRLWVYDNRQGSGSSRIVAYRLDEQAMTATQDDEWDGGAEWGWYTGFWGDVDVLPNGNLLIGSGNPDTRRALEWDPATREAAWAVEFPPPFTFYRVERIELAALGLRRLGP